MFISLSVALALILMSLALSVFSAAIGYLTAVFGRHYFPHKRGTFSEYEVLPDQASLSDRNQIDTLINTLYELTSHVDSQVSQHSLRVGEITNSLERPEDVESKIVLVAGKLLIKANEKLQADLEEAKKEIQRQREQMNSCMQESRTDSLTSLPNRRAFDQELIRVFAQLRRDNSAFSLMIIDIDRFKRINDQYGHMVGDQILKSFSRCLMSTFRESDFVARFGGEEFVAILPQTSIDEARLAAERVRNAIVESLHNTGELELRITASIGVKEIARGETDKELLQKADKALYEAKNDGRNCCYFHDGTTCHRIAPVEFLLDLHSEMRTASMIEIASEAPSEMKVFHSHSERKHLKISGLDSE